MTEEKKRRGGPIPGRRRMRRSGKPGLLGGDRPKRKYTVGKRKTVIRADSLLDKIPKSAYNSRLLMDEKDRPTFHRTLRCKVCQHPEKEAIELAYFNWQTRVSIVKDFDISPSSLRNHILSLRLDMRRCDNTEGMLDRIIEKGMRSLPPVDSRTLHSAIRLKMELSGKLDNTAKTNIVIISPGARQDRLEAGLNIFGVTLSEKKQIPVETNFPPMSNERRALPFGKISGNISEEEVAAVQNSVDAESPEILEVNDAEFEEVKTETQVTAEKLTEDIEEFLEKDTWGQEK